MVQQMAMRWREEVPIGHQIGDSIDLFLIHFAYNFHNYANWHISHWRLTSELISITHNMCSMSVSYFTWSTHRGECVRGGIIDVSEFLHPQMNDEIENNRMEVVGL